MENKIVKGYTACNKNMKCRGFQYEEGKTYKTDEAVCCQKRFHLYTNPLDMLTYYDLCNSEFHQVKALGDINKNEGDSKLSTTKIKIGVKLSLKQFIEESISFLSNNKQKENPSGDYSKLAASGDDSKLATSGDYSQLATSGDDSKLAASGYNSKLAASGDYNQLATSGDYSKLATSGDDSKLATSGDYSQLATSGYNSKLAASGYNSKLAASGDYNQLATSGNYSKLATSGGYSKLAASGDGSQVELNGKNNVGANIGIQGQIKGVKGSWITLAEYDCKNNIICVKAAQIDGKKIKENIWYKLKNKKFTEVK